VRYNALFLFTNNKCHSQRSTGYEDGWEDDKFYYSGSGSIGDQKWNFNNTELRDHIANCKEVLLFENIGDGFVKLVGRMQLLDYYKKDLKDTTGKTRKIIEFVLGRKSNINELTTTKKKRNIDDRNDTQEINTVKRLKISDKSPTEPTLIPSQSLSESLSLSECKTQTSQLRKSTKSLLSETIPTQSQPQTQYESLSQYSPSNQSQPKTQYETLSQFQNFPLTQQSSTYAKLSFSQSQIDPNSEDGDKYDISQNSPCSQEKYNYLITQRNDAQVNLAPLPLSQPKTQPLTPQNKISDYSSKLNEEFLEAIKRISSQELPLRTSTQKLSHIDRNTHLNTQPSQHH